MEAGFWSSAASKKLFHTVAIVIHTLLPCPSSWHLTKVNLWCYVPHPDAASAVSQEQEGRMG